MHEKTPLFLHFRDKNAGYPKENAHAGKRSVPLCKTVSGAEGYRPTKQTAARVSEQAKCAALQDDLRGSDPDRQSKRPPLRTNEVRRFAGRFPGRRATDAPFLAKAIGTFSNRYRNPAQRAFSGAFFSRSACLGVAARQIPAAICQMTERKSAKQPSGIEPNDRIKYGQMTEKRLTTGRNGV